MAQMSRKLLTDLIHLLTPYVRTQQERTSLLTQAFTATSVLSHIDYSGSAHTFAIQPVSHRLVKRRFYRRSQDFSYIFGYGSQYEQPVGVAGRATVGRHAFRPREGERWRSL